MVVKLPVKQGHVNFTCLFFLMQILNNYWWRDYIRTKLKLQGIIVQIKIVRTKVKLWSNYRDWWWNLPNNFPCETRHIKKKLACGLLILYHAQNRPINTTWWWMRERERGKLVPAKNWKNHSDNFLLKTNKCTLSSQINRRAGTNQVRGPHNWMLQE